MKGLLLKDFRLLKGQKNFYLVIAMVGACMLLTNMDSFFVISYCSLVFSIFSISTISYDEFGKGYSFLLTLPFSRKMYALEKYVFGLLTGGVAWCVTTAIVFITKWWGTEDVVGNLVGAVAIYATLFMMLCIMIPIQMKFGADKGKIAMFAIVVVVGILFGGVKKALELFHIALNVAWITQMPLEVLIALGILVFIALTGISMAISIRIMEKKEL